MSGIKIITDSLCLKHKSGFDHPESPSRINSIVQAYKNSPSILTDIRLNKNDLLRDDSLFDSISDVHSNHLIKQLESSSKQKTTFFNFDCIANKFTYLSALSSSKLATTASELSTHSESYFALIRPPGHHASSSEMMGFCYINNIAVAASYQASKGKKVAIIDFDCHYGNGTANIFWENPNILYISIHADPAINYPNSGFINEIGEGDGTGYNICVPFSFGSGDNELINAITGLVFPILDEFHPNVIGISAGFDGYYDDPVGLGFLKYTNKGYNAIGNLFHNYSKIKKIPVFHVLEGGYNISQMPKLINSYVKPWMNHSNRSSKMNKLIFSDTKLKTKKKEKESLRIIRKLIKPYWNLS
ncbi:MAG: histone deacetylase family protein [Candidatus Hodarchaeales archaeon]